MLKINTVTMEEKIENLIFLGVDCSKEERKKLTKELLNLFSVNYYGESIYNTNGIIKSKFDDPRIVAFKNNCS
jgi:hypothetical protein